MNRYPFWKYVLIAIALLFGTLYTLPNFFGESPAVQISSAKSTIKVDSLVAERVRQILQQGKLAPESIVFDDSGAPSVRARFVNTDI
ncbi:MAG TPA: protein translocase subunit SecD, partial [Herbaspirillum sp.]|nr:protein translocase subunit SecD [Herbaspirillum sp.]